MSGLLSHKNQFTKIVTLLLVLLPLSACADIDKIERGSDSSQIIEGLNLVYHEDFGKDYYTTRSDKWKDEIEAKDGVGLVEATREDSSPGPAGMTFANFEPKGKFFNPNMKGTNGFEITLTGYSHEENYPKELDKQIPRQHIMGWAIAITGANGGNLQFHIDYMGSDGLYCSFVRQPVLSDDWDKYPNDGFALDAAVAAGALSEEKRKEVDKYSHLVAEDEKAWRKAQDVLIKRGTFVSYPVVVMSCDIIPDAEKFLSKSHKFGLFITDDGKKAFWTLDDRVMNVSDIEGLFPAAENGEQYGGSVFNHAAGVYQQNIWEIDDVKVYSSETHAPFEDDTFSGTVPKPLRNTEIDYINKDIPKVELPDYEGETYQAKVPDTLDLQERASMAINGLTGPVDPTMDYEIYWLVYMKGNRPVMSRDLNHQVQLIMQRSVPLCRLINGSRQSLAVEQRWLEVVMQSQGDDGLMYYPLKGREGWIHYAKGAMGGQYNGFEGDQYTGPLNNGWTAELLGIYYQLTGEERYKIAGQRLVDGMARQAVRRDGYAFFNKGIYGYGEITDHNTPLPNVKWKSATNGWTAYGLVQFYRSTG